jgi:heme/copper-type cytochrome/quinol oxidase subunit 3
MPADTRPVPEIQYATLEQQGEAAQFGIWIFLTQETIFSGALIFIYFLYRITYRMSSPQPPRIRCCGAAR